MTEVTADAVKKRCGFIALIGVPNAGKSTLINRLVGTKVSIVTPKAQTTRVRCLGVVISGGSQLLFVDTPGIFTPRRQPDEALVTAAWSEVDDSDVIVLLADAAKALTDGTEDIVKKLKMSGRKAVLAVNKIDLVAREKLLPLVAKLHASGIFTHVFMISAVTGDGVADLLNHMSGAVQEGPWLYPDDQLTDMPMRDFAAEITREQLFFQLQEELPYATSVTTDAWEDFDNGDVRINQTVFVQRESQKAIVLGKGGARVKSLGEAARKEMSRVFDRRVHLMLHVKVAEEK